MNKLTMAALGLTLTIGSAFAVPPQAVSSLPKAPVKKAKVKKAAPHVITSAANPKPVVVR